MVRRRVGVLGAAGVAVAGVLAAGLVLAGGATSTGGGTASSGGPASSGGAGSTAVVAPRGPGNAAGGVPGNAGASDAVAPDVAVAPDGPAPEPDTAAAGKRAEAAPPVPGTPGAGVSPLPDAVGRDVVRTAQLTVQVPDAAAAARSVRTAAAAAGGFVAEEQVDPAGSWLVLRVPVARLDRLVDDLAATGTVLARSGRAEDATEQVVDLDARVASQQASVTRVRELLARARSIGDVVAVESELARREADLDSLERRRAALHDQVALSTLTVELRGAPAPAPVPTPPGFGSGLGAGWAGLKVAGAVLATVAGFMLPFLPLLVVVGAVVWGVRRLRARRRRRGPAPEGTPA
jgi:hypothetical protein